MNRSPDCTCASRTRTSDGRRASRPLFGNSLLAHRLALSGSLHRGGRLLQRLDHARHRALGLKEALGHISDVPREFLQVEAAVGLLRAVGA